MTFDIQDIQAGTIKDMMGVIVSSRSFLLHKAMKDKFSSDPNLFSLKIQLHEMGHVVSFLLLLLSAILLFASKTNILYSSQLGIGSLWVINGLTQSYTVPCPYGVATKASQEYRDLSGCSGSIPIENQTGQRGSDCAHWRESCFSTELMTSAANGNLPVSRITIAGLDDLGYEVNYNEADPYTSSDMSPQCLCNNRLRRQLSNTTRAYSLDGMPTNRRLSGEGYSIAMSYGKQVLAQNRDSMSLFQDPNATDIGDQITFVLYLEQDVVHRIMVTADD